MFLTARALGWLDRLVGRSVGPREVLLESLEPRQLLDAAFPLISDLVDPLNSVVRINTTLGEIDFELYSNSGPGGSAPAPITVNNFLNYVNSGRYLDSFFHRSVVVSSSNPAIDGQPFVLQGGGFTFDDDTGLGRVTTDPAIANEFNAGRSNVERSIAMALVGLLGPDSATSQYFINLRDNNGSMGSGDIDLDAQNFTVFGRVANDRSWQVVQAISSLNTFVFADIIVDDNGDPVLDPQGRTQFLDNPLADPVSFALSDVPVVTAPAPIPPLEIRSTALEERFLVKVTSALSIKPDGVNRFYTFRVGYPEGYANDTSVTYLELTHNLSSGEAATYQVVLRYENGVRDQVLLTDTLAAGQRTRIALSDPALTDEPQARKFSPFAIEVHSTRPMSATLTHTDFGATLSEAFVNYADLTSRGAGAFNVWDFGGLATTRGSTDNVIERESYLVWQSLSTLDGTVTVQVFTDASVFNVITFPLDANRRGGVELHNLFGFTTDGVQAIRVTSDVAIIAAMSTYDRISATTGEPAISTNAYATQGLLGGGKRQGVLAGARRSGVAAQESYVSFFNPNPVGTVITLTITDTDGNSANTSVVLAPRDIGFYNMNRLNIDFGGVFTADKILTLRYSSVQPVAAHYTATIGAETMSTAFQTQLTDVVILSGGFDAGTAGSEVISLYNPYSLSAGITLNFSIQFYFEDRDIFLPFSGLPMLAPGERADISARDFSSVLSVIQLGEAWQRYTIFIAGIALPTGGGTTPNAGQFGVTLSRVGAESTIGRDAVTMHTGTFGEGTIRDLATDFSGGSGG